MSKNFAGTLFVICFANYWFVIVVIPILIMYYFLQKFYVTTARQVKSIFLMGYMGCGKSKNKVIFSDSDGQVITYYALDDELFRKVDVPDGECEQPARCATIRYHSG